MINYKGEYVYRVEGIDVKWITRRNNTVSSLRTAKKAIERAWSLWLVRAELS